VGATADGPIQHHRIANKKQGSSLPCFSCYETRKRKTRPWVGLLQSRRCHSSGSRRIAISAADSAGRQPKVARYPARAYRVQVSMSRENATALRPRGAY
jgi:hypothetical protein